MQDSLRNLLAPSNIYAIYSSLELLNAVLENTLDRKQLKQHCERSGRSKCAITKGMSTRSMNNSRLLSEPLKTLSTLERLLDTSSRKQSTIHLLVYLSTSGTIKERSKPLGRPSARSAHHLPGRSEPASRAQIFALDDQGPGGFDTFRSEFHRLHAVNLATRVPDAILPRELNGIVKGGIKNQTVLGLVGYIDSMRQTRMLRGRGPLKPWPTFSRRSAQKA